MFQNRTEVTLFWPGTVPVPVLVLSLQITIHDTTADKRYIQTAIKQYRETVTYHVTLTVAASLNTQQAALFAHIIRLNLYTPFYEAMLLVVCSRKPMGTSLHMQTEPECLSKLTISRPCQQPHKSNHISYTLSPY